MGFSGVRGDGVGSPKSAMDKLSDALNSKSSLPGRWGLIQHLFEIWSGDLAFQHPIFHAFRIGRNVFNSAAAVREYKQSKIPEVKRNDPIITYLSERNLISSHDLRTVCDFMVYYLKLSNTPFTEYKIRDVNGKEVEGTTIREYQAGDIKIVYQIKGWNSAYGVREWCEGPYLLEKDIPVLIPLFGSIIWNHHSGQDLQLNVGELDWAGNAQFELNAIGKPDEYIPGDGTWEDVHKLAERVQRLNSQNIRRNILFYGPPGVGKTTLARNLARKIGNGRALRVDPQALDMISDSLLMQMIKILKPQVILFDDIDRQLDTIKEMLRFMERETESLSNSSMTVIATINVLDYLDPALLRPGRFDEVIECKEPTKEIRLRILEHYCRKMGILEKVNAAGIDVINEAMESFSPADVAEVVRCISAAGIESWEIEVQRVGIQRGLYSGDACLNFMDRIHGTKHKQPVPTRVSR